jgi:Chitin synthase
MAGVFKNIHYLTSRTKSQTWGKDAWKKVVVCVVSDGRGKINPRTRSVLAGMGCYQEGIAKQKVNDKDVTAHIYEVRRVLFLFLHLLWVFFIANMTVLLVYNSSWHRTPGRPGKTHPGWQTGASANAVLPQGEKSKKDQLASLVF